MHGFFDYFLVRRGEVLFNFAVNGIVEERFEKLLFGRVRNIVPAFLEEKVYCSELAIGRSLFGFAVVKFLKNVFI